MQARASQTPDIVFKAVAADPLAGACQLLADAQRFGLQIVEFCMVIDVQGWAAIHLGIGATPGCDMDVLRCRFARHPALRSVEVIERSCVRRITP